MPTFINIGNCCNCGGGACPCPDTATLYLDFEGEVIELTGGPGSWSGSGSPGGCASTWDFTVTCLGEIWQLVITNPDSATCVLNGPDWQGEILSCNPIEVEFVVTVNQPPMASCCLGGSFPRDISIIVTL